VKTTNHHELLQAYAQDHSESAFQELVQRYLDLVYSAAIRRVSGDRQLAEDVTQEVFTDLARKAAALPPTVMLGGWLHRHTGYVASTAMRGEQRRRDHERQAVEMNALNEPSDADWSQFAPVLDEAMDEMDAADRDALVLRYFERCELREVGLALGVSDDTAQKRVSRALEKLRQHLARRGITSPATALSAVIMANAVQAAPAALAATITATALAGKVTTTTIATHTILTTMFNAKATIATLGAAALVGTGTYLVQQRQVEALRAENQNLLAQRQQLTADQEAAAKAAQSTKEQSARVQQDNTELLRLRNEVGQLRQAAKQRPSEAAATTSTGQSAANPGRHISNDQLVFVGYATPEAAMESGAWALIKGTHEQRRAAMGLNGQQQQAHDPKSGEKFEIGSPTTTPPFTGYQIVARKNLADDKVELKVKMDWSPNPNVEMPPFMIQSIVKVGTEWRSGGSRAYQDNWDQEGQIQPLTP